MNAIRMSPAAGIVLATLGASAVVLGAFGAHALRGAFSLLQMAIWHTAVQYHFWHALAFALAAIMPARGRAARTAMWLFAIGVVLFCGSLYALALGAPNWIGIITPFGGVAFIIGWIAFGIAYAKGF